MGYDIAVSSHLWIYTTCSWWGFVVCRGWENFCPPLYISLASPYPRDGPPLTSLESWGPTGIVVTPYSLTNWITHTHPNRSLVKIFSLEIPFWYWLPYTRIKDMYRILMIKTPSVYSSILLRYNLSASKSAHQKYYIVWRLTESVATSSV